ncbi:hypothetical protein COU61_01030, partial [Candidatus Pacearchaeota archaeon CG10_big_fil_rev_8_21_14_0_10_35_13]
MPVKKYSISEVLELYDLEFDKLVPELSVINSSHSSDVKAFVLLQFPDGLKMYSTTVVDYLSEKFDNIVFLIWMDSCFGACDTPVLGKKLEEKFSLIVQFGHVP